MKCFIFLAIVLLTSAGAFTGSQPGRDGEIKKDDDLSITTIRPLSISSISLTKSQECDAAYAALKANHCDMTSFSDYVPTLTLDTWKDADSSALKKAFLQSYAHLSAGSTCSGITSYFTQCQSRSS